MSLAWKVTVTVVLFLVAAGGHRAHREPPRHAAHRRLLLEHTGPAGERHPADCGHLRVGNHPTWVSYLVKSPDGQWVHTTLFQVPQHVRINVTIVQYDSGSPLRNQQVGQVTGTYANAALLNGKAYRVINSNVGNGVAHTFSMPSLGINVPLYGNNGNANLCAAAPCTTKSPHQVIRFSFTSPGTGSYRWQCFVPCGLRLPLRQRGPMSTLGYMGGFMKVVA